ncbi:putative PhnH protein, phosphonate metabolism [Bradyrhizobium sp. ORS 285]|uniref:phosphonate C-P lyase system protein PhnH n=1 Tax=Bradyrhizobium sp. ORS 285 TaxID=115808 RepID=UPI0002407295|nr:phosphonate C-P lyase system protein PhnH [Bradyrhizobium sp. ORS 285]CCD84391.1 putative PhnH protein, phosphonate metabolism [Bradyrhizobium sp. ORS 285]SMX57034.1 putative PhnH protein, phosphonate metabolism [Bradyrhizobium sp. ORS 285]
MAATTIELQPGFADKVLSAQSTFRTVMEAMARPGQVMQVRDEVGGPSSMMAGVAAIALTLLDQETPLWLDEAFSSAPDVSAWLKFHTGAPIVARPDAASFALVAEPAALPDLASFALGTPEYPDRSTTLIMQVPSLTAGETFHLRGPGIDGTTALTATIEPIDLFVQLSINEALFPRGIDVILVDDRSLVAIPRTTRLASSGV